MKPGRKSTSAEAVALSRALESSRSEADRLFEDAFAYGFLSPAAVALFHLLRVPVLGALLLGVSDRLAPGVRGFTLGRTRYIDEALIASLRDGLDQVVVLGAGYDSRAYRIAGIENAQVFEVDHPDTQRRKRAALDRLLVMRPEHVRFVPVDFNRQTLGEAMAAAGFRGAGRTFFIWEGVTEYLGGDTVDAMFRYLARAAAGESRVVFTYTDRSVLAPGRRLSRAGALIASHLFGRESRTFGIEPGELCAYLSERGLELIEDVAGAEFQTRYFEPMGRRVRTNEFERTALARIVGSPVEGGASRGAQRI